MTAVFLADALATCCGLTKCGEACLTPPHAQVEDSLSAWATSSAASDASTAALSDEQSSLDAVW